MTQPVRLLFFTQTFGCETCISARRILDEVARLTPLVTIEEINLVLDRERASTFAIDRAPAIAIVGVDADGHERDSHIRFLGATAGYEFVSLVRAIALVGGGPSSLTAASRARIASVADETTIHVFSTPTCPHCPRAVVLAHEMAFLNPRITAYAVEATEFPDLARQYRVTGVPKTVVGDRIEILGALPEEDFINQVLPPAAAADGVETNLR